MCIRQTIGPRQRLSIWFAMLLTSLVTLERGAVDMGGVRKVCALPKASSAPFDRGVRGGGQGECAY